ncbi:MULTISPECIES: hypothetical protein [unclassified Streptomyces]|uniref:hypothetical protein n=1 Tax=unclassified Streptomyces TaxID=2593676 RepID=UPI003689EFA2
MRTVLLAEGDILLPTITDYLQIAALSVGTTAIVVILWRFVSRVTRITVNEERTRLLTEVLGEDEGPIEAAHVEITTGPVRSETMVSQAAQSPAS